jgi:hypothetical protein
MKFVHYLVLLTIMLAKPLYSQVPAITHVSCVGSTNGSIKMTMPTGSTYTYSWQPGGQTTSSITTQGAGAYTLRVIRATPAATLNFAYNIGYKAKWQFLSVGHTISTNGDTLKNNTAATAWSRTTDASNEIPASTNGWIEYVVTTTSHNKGFGLIDAGSASGWTNVDYAFQLSSGGSMIATDNIAMVTSTPGSYVVGDVLRIERAGSNIIFKKNNVTFWTRSITAGMAASVLKIRASIYDALSRIENLGCSAPANTVSAGLTQTITCSSPTVVLTGSSSAAGVTYSWPPGSVTTSTLSVSSVGTYTLKVTDSFYGCVVSSTVAVAVNTLAPGAGFTANPGTTLTCVSPTAILTGTSSTSGVTYSWPPGSVTTSTLSVSSANTYTLRVTDPSNGCSSTKTISITSNTVLPNISSTGNKTLTCTSPTAVLSGTSTTSGATYSWSPGGVTTPTRSVSSAATYTLKVTNPSNGCSASLTVSAISNTASPNISTTGNQTITCTSPIAVLSGTSTTSGATYLWSPGGALTSSISVSTTGSYILNIRNPVNGCTSTNTVVVTYTCTEVPNYFVLKKTLGSGYYAAYHNVIYFAFEEEYFDSAQGTANSLSYVIVNDMNDPITTVPGLVEVIGDNRFHIDLSTVSGMSPGEFYRIAITNKKKEVFYARFKY